MQSLDFFPKTQPGLSERTLSGGVISAASLLFVLWAGASELSDCWRVVTDERLVPQATSEHSNTLSINLDVVFPSTPCSEVVVELTDETGREQLRPTDSLSKLRMSAGGSPVGLPEELGFEARAALGVRMRRFMHMLHDCLVALLSFSATSGCARDYTALSTPHPSTPRPSAPRGSTTALPHRSAPPRSSKPLFQGHATRHCHRHRYGVGTAGGPMPSRPLSTPVQRLLVHHRVCPHRPAPLSPPGGGGAAVGGASPQRPARCEQAPCPSDWFYQGRGMCEAPSW